MANSKDLSSLIKKDLEGWKKKKTAMSRAVANEAVNFYTRSFRNKGFLDEHLVKWPMRKARKGEKKKVSDRRGLLIGKGGSKKLSRSIRALRISSRDIKVGSTIKDYSGVHNYGLRSGRGKGFIMPKRQFMGHSRKLNKEINKLIIRKINEAFR